MRTVCNIDSPLEGRPGQVIFNQFWRNSRVHTVLHKTGLLCGSVSTSDEVMVNPDHIYILHHAVSGPLHFFAL